MEAGKLYLCEEYFLLLYPDQEAAAAARSGWDCVSSALAVHAGDADEIADYWSNRFGKPVLYAKKNIPLLILNNREKYIEVLAGDRKGWIIFNDYLKNIKEIDYAPSR